MDNTKTFDPALASAILRGLGLTATQADAMANLTAQLEGSEKRVTTIQPIY